MTPADTLQILIDTQRQAHGPDFWKAGATAAQTQTQSAFALTINPDEAPTLKDFAQASQIIAREYRTSYDLAIDLTRDAWIDEQRRRYAPTVTSAEDIKKALVNSGKLVAVAICDLNKSAFTDVCRWTLYDPNGDDGSEEIETAHGLALDVLDKWRAKYPLATIKGKRQNTQGEYSDPDEGPYNGDEYSSSRHSSSDREDFHSDG